MILLGYRLQLLPLLQCQAYLTNIEWQYAQTLTNKRALQFCNGRALIRQLLLRYHGISYNNIAIDLPTDKAPTLRVLSEPWQLSISHSAQAIAVAISQTNRLGLDIEQIKARNITEFITEYPALAGAKNLTEFYQHWTAAEAYSKYSGEPLLNLLQQSVKLTEPQYHLSLHGYMLCLTYQYADAKLEINEQKQAIN
ncbi:hypothetical protein E0Z06_14870 [Rheinheimera sp. D18]|uniref:4'-phosphopantetheinyl transferase family protein n=1 Tax=Rheinheimera sp. D18 TaxID=2545632 RepID=UPI0010480561|nr:hypothetical protein [Rheinheimera sp. D18]QBL10713.1 hypothetical protein E0Z06_14870 [Rheinheimera sp. D18]